MSDIKFACPQCQQHIQCEPGYAGMEINCPTCSTRIIVPGTPAPAPAPALAMAQSQAPAPPPPMPQTRLATSTAPATGGCPSCGAALPRGAVLCTRCGFNLATGQRTVAGRPAPRGKAMAPRGDTKWYKTSYPYLGAFALLMITLLLVGKTASKDGPNIAIMAYLGLGILFYGGVRMMTVVLAFKDGAGTGFLCLCLEFYAIRWVYSESENSFLKASYPLAILLAVLLFVI